MHTECCCAAAAAVAAAASCVANLLLLLLPQQCCCFLLLFVVVQRIVKFVAGSLNLIPVFSFSSFKRDIFLSTPWQYRVAFMVSICPRSHSVNEGMHMAMAAVNPPWRSYP